MRSMQRSRSRVEGYPNKKRPRVNRDRFEKVIYPGSVHISQTLAGQVLPALRSLTAVFGMRTGVSSSPWPPE